MKLKILQNILDFCKGKKTLQRNEIYVARKKQSKILKRLQNKVKTGEKIKIGFFLFDRRSVPTYNLFRLMQNDDAFEPYWIVVPDREKGSKFSEKNYNDAIQYLTETFGKEYLIDCYDENGNFKIINDKVIDIAYFNYAYQELFHPYHQVKNIIEKGILTLYSPYGMLSDKTDCLEYRTDAVNSYWRIFIEYPETLKDLRKIMKNKKSLILSGYPKFDNYKPIKKDLSERKNIILAPWHELESFVKFADAYLSLPKKYPNIDFVYRPHPLAFYFMVERGIWTQAQVDEYLEKMLSYPNVKYSTEGDYYEVFAKSDGIIHNCSSFRSEYLITENPSCYVELNKAVRENFNTICNKCIENYYVATCEKDMHEYIENVIINGNDPLNEKRIKFVEKSIKVHYPNNSLYILNYLKEQFGIKDIKD